MSNITNITEFRDINVEHFLPDEQAVEKSVRCRDKPILFLEQNDNVSHFKLSARNGEAMSEGSNSDQEKYIAQYLKEWDEKGSIDCDITKINDAVATLRTTKFNWSCLENCSLRQRESIVRYGAQMVDNGYKDEFIVNVCEMMSKLYQYTIKRNDKFMTVEDVLSPMTGDIIKNNYIYRGRPDSEELTSREYFQAMDEFLTKFMSENGGDYQIVENFLNTIGSCSQYKLSIFFKAFCYSTRANLEEEDYFSLNPDEKIKVHKEDEKSHGDEASDDDDDEDVYTGSYDPRFLSKTFSDYNSETLSELFFKNAEIPDKGKYVKSMTINRAFIAIALSCVDFPDLNKDSYTIKVFRSSADEIKQPGIADSCSLYKSCWVPWHYSYSGYCLLEAEIPVCDVYAAYPLSQKLWDGNVHEMICNFIHFKEIKTTAGLGVSDEGDGEVAAA